MLQGAAGGGGERKKEAPKPTATDVWRFLKDHKTGMGIRKT